MNLVDTNTIAFDDLSESKQLYILKTIKKHADEMPQIEADIKRQVEFLKENGFVEGEHFDWVINTRTRQDYVYLDNKDSVGQDRFFFNYEVMDGFIRLIRKRFYDSSGMSWERDPIEVTQDDLISERGYTMERRGKYKPKTILARLKYLNELADVMEADFDKKALALEFAKQELAKHYPTSVITSHKNYDWRRNNYNQNADVVRIQFPSGSYAKIVISSKGDEIIEVHDVEAKRLTFTQTLNKLNQQEPCGV